MADTRLFQPDLEMIREIKKAGGDQLNKCYQCATCSVVCNLSPEDSPFPRKEMLLAQWGQTEKLVADPDIWLCYQCNDCSIHCPRGAKPGDVLAAIRSFTYKYFSILSFMGKALASPRFLPILLLVPVLILIACIYISAPRTADGDFLFLHSSMSDPVIVDYVSKLHGVVEQPVMEAGADQPGSYIDFNIFLPHSTVDALFVGGNILIFILAAVGFLRFWRSLRADGRERVMSLSGALVATVKEIILHSRFFKCETNKSRSWPHIMLLAGFVGAMITTGMVFVFIFIPHYLELLGLEQMQPFFLLPIDFPHPVKILGALSGVLLCVGGVWILYRRFSDDDGTVGVTSYGDSLFLWIITLTGLTGMMSWLIRVAGIPNLAYASYFAHIVLVFFLLWYMPYSKFAHMIYRALALVHATSVGRKARS